MRIKAKSDSGIYKQIYWLIVVFTILFLLFFFLKSMENKELREKFPKVFLSKSERQSVSAIKTLMELIKTNHDNILFLSVKDESSNRFSQDLRKNLDDIGGNEISQLGWRNSYVGVIQQGKFINELRSSSEAVKVDYNGAIIESAGFEHGNYSKFSNQSQSISFVETGLNVVVVSSDGALIATYNFDYFSASEPLPFIRFFNVVYEELNSIELNISRKNYEKLKTKRDKAVKTGILLTERDDLVKAEFSDDDSVFPCEIRLKGDWTDHLSGEQWSFRVNLEKDRAWHGMQKFSLHHPRARNYLGEWLFHKMLEQEDILHLNYDFVQLDLIIDDGIGQEVRSLGLYALEEFFTKQLIEKNQRRSGILLKLDEDPIWQERADFMDNGLPLDELEMFHQDDLAILPFGASAIRSDSNLMKQFRMAKALFSGYLNGTTLISDAFDVEKLATANVIANLMGLIMRLYRIIIGCIIIL